MFASNMIIDILLAIPDFFDYKPRFQALSPCHASWMLCGEDGDGMYA